MEIVGFKTPISYSNYIKFQINYIKSQDQKKCYKKVTFIFF